MPASPTLTALASFSGTNGNSPQASLILDSNGDLFGTTAFGGQNGDGEVFEVAHTAGSYASTPTVLYSFTNGTDGGFPSSSLLADGTGDLFGTTQGGTPNSVYGTVFEIARSGAGFASTPTILHSFTNTDGATPFAGLVSDAAGNLFGTTTDGGTNNNGVVFEIAKTASGYAATPTVLYDFGSGAAPQNPEGNLILDTAGDLFGTTQLGGADNDGTVFEIAKNGSTYASTPTILYAFTGSDGAQPMAALVADAAGDLFGTTSAGGTDNDGVVFEIQRTGSGFASTPTTLYSFTGGNDGANPVSTLLIDAAGNLFGTTQGFTSTRTQTPGSVFELQRTASGYASTVTVLSNFMGQANGSEPAAGLVADAAGNLFGTAFLGGTGGDGTVFEITNSGFQVACFAQSTRIATTRGEVAVEDLRVGDMALTAGGAARPVVWLGHRRTDCARHTRPWDVMPVRVRADAFGPGAPARDLVLSPDHAVFVGGALVPVRYLLNGASVAQESVAAVTYWHVELDAHDVLLAEGLPCESYLDTGNRSAFANGGAVVQAHPAFARAVWAGRGCAPLVTDGPVVEAAKSRLIGRLGGLGFDLTRATELAVFADGARVQTQVFGEWCCIALPDGARRLSLRSPAARPADLDPASADGRALGVSLCGLRLDGREVALDDPCFAAGWHAAEPGLRWSDGEGVLAVGGCQVAELRLGPAVRRAVRVSGGARGRAVSGSHS